MNGAQESWRRAAVRSCEAFFLLILLEGILRKWLMNSIQQQLLFIRDPVLALIYLQYFGYRRWRPPLWSFAMIALLVLFMLVILIQSIYLDLPATVYLIGIRNYIVYIPLSFIICEIFNRSDVNRWLRLLLYTSVPVAVLTVLQFLSPPSSPLNKALDDSADGVFLVADGVVRPYGPFTFTYGQALYAAMAVSAAIIVVERRKEVRISTPMLLICLISVGVMGVVSGSRTYFLTIGGILCCYGLSAILSPRKSLIFTRLVYATAGIFGIYVLLIAVFPTAWATLVERQADAVATEGSIFNRVLFIGTEVLSVIEDTPLFGNGIGFGSNAGAYLANGYVSFTLAEYEWTRIVLECGPILGLFVVACRMFLTMVVGVVALRVNSCTGDAGPLIMYGFVCPLVFYSPISDNNTLLSLAWFSLGLLLALIKTARGGTPRRRAVFRRAAP